MKNCLIIDGGSVTGLRASGVTYMFSEPIAQEVLKRGGKAFITAFEENPIKALQDIKVEIEGLPLTTNKSKGEFIGYKGGYSDKGKGSPEGDGKDKAMREVADGFIGEIVKKDSSSYTSAKTIQNKVSNPEDAYEDLTTPYNSVNSIASGNLTPLKAMLARNGEFKNKPLEKGTKDFIRDIHDSEGTFVVGDMPGVDTQFIEYLIEIGAKFEVYHTGNKSRIDVESMMNNRQVQNTIEDIPFSKSREPIQNNSTESIEVKSIKQLLSDYGISYESLPNEAKTKLTNNPSLINDPAFIDALKCL
jgi:hypothetical protein